MDRYTGRMDVVIRVFDIHNPSRNRGNGQKIKHFPYCGPAGLTCLKINSLENLEFLVK